MKTKHVSRIDSKNTHAYLARISYKGKIYSRSFSDGVCGGKIKALEQAVVWRDNKLKEFGIPLSDRKAVTFSSRNKSGVIGIRICYKGDQRYYSVTYPTKEVGRSERKHFKCPSTNSGSLRVLRTAVRFLRERQREVYGRTITGRWQAIGLLERGV